MDKKILSIIAMLFCLVLSFACQPAANHPAEPTLKAPSIEVDPMQVDSGWGYTIVVDGKPFIRQDHIPALPGKQVFKTKAMAEKVGQWVADRIKRNERITVTTEVLQEMMHD